MNARADQPPEDPPSRSPKGGRPRKLGDRREAHLILRVSHEEKATIQAAAQRVGLSASDYVRRRALNAQIPSRPVGADPALISELNAIGNNLNQLTRAVHRGSAFQEYWRDVGHQLRLTLAKVLDR